MKYKINYNKSKYRHFCEIKYKNRETIGKYKKYKVYNCENYFSIEDNSNLKMKNLKDYIFELQNKIDELKSNLSKTNKPVKIEELNKKEICKEIENKIKNLNMIINLYLKLKQILDDFLIKDEEKNKIFKNENPFNVKNYKNFLNIVNEQIEDIKFNINLGNDITKCKEFNSKYNNLIESHKDKIIFLKNKYQDLLNSVRVFVRINNPNNIENISYEAEIKSINEKKQFNIVKKNACNGISNDDEYNNFFEVYDSKTKNLEIFNGNDKVDGMKDVLLQCLYGYSVILFGYGYSGSGKTYTLIEGDDSILKNCINEIKKIGNTKIEIEKIEELYGYYKPKDAQKGIIETKNIIYKSYNNRIINNYNFFKEKILDPINSDRVKYKHIKATPNNNKSSRSHLFITLKITNDEKVGYLTLVDMAGIEDPIDLTYTIIPTIDLAEIFYPEEYIKNFFFNKKAEQKKQKLDNIEYKLKIENYKKTNDLYSKLISFDKELRKLNYLKNENKKKEIDDFIKQKIEYENDYEDQKRIDYIRNSIRLMKYNQDQFIGSKIKINETEYSHGDYSKLIGESIFINESINHLSFYFKNKKTGGFSINDNDIMKNADDSFYYNKNIIKLNSKTYLNNKFLFNPKNIADNKEDYIGMYQKLKELDKLSNNTDKSSKFLMLALIRPELDSKFCMGAKKTLDFALEIKST